MKIKKMKKPLKAGSSAESDTENIQVHIVGPMELQNSLMAQFLQQQTGIKCFYHNDMGSISAESASRVLILWDGYEKTLDDFSSDFEQVSEDIGSEYQAAVFNINKASTDVYRDAPDRGIRGIFFLNDTFELISKGVCAIVADEYWYPRELLSRWMTPAANFPNHEQKNSIHLTEREKEVLDMVSSGASNDEIAEKLTVSYHTVKTHLSNIYRKIGASNRLQASLWALKYL